MSSSKWQVKGKTDYKSISYINKVKTKGILQKLGNSFPSESFRQVVLKLVCLSKLPLEIFRNNFFSWEILV